MLEKLSRDLEGDPEWREARKRIDKEGMKLMAELLKKSLYYLMHTNEPNPKIVRHLSCLIHDAALFVSNHLDETGASAILAERAVGHIGKLSFSDFAPPLSFELALIRELEIPNYVWSDYCVIIEKQKGRLLEEMDTRGREFSLKQFLEPKISFLLGESEYRFQQMSPFRWGKAIATGLGVLILTANTTFLTPSCGISVASIFAGTVGAAFVSGLE